MIQYVVTVTWYKPVMTAVAGFLIVSCLVFLLSFRPKRERNLVALAMVWLAFGVIAHCVPPLWRLYGSGLPAPAFGSHRHAAGVLVPYGFDVVAVVILLVVVARERRSRRAADAGGGGGWSVSRRLGQRRRQRRSSARRSPGRGTPGRRSDTAGWG